MNDLSPEWGELRPHPLAVALIERLRTNAPVRVLELGTGSGRNRNALTAAGFMVESFETLPERADAFGAAISTHALLHGTRESIAAALERIARLLRPGSPLYATFASIRDARYGRGTQVAPHAYASETGDEAGVAHAFFDEISLRESLAPWFEIESLQERAASAIVGRWAHSAVPEGTVHYFLIARKRGIDA